MAELLQRATAMKVVQVKDRMKVEPDRVYVIPPNKDMSILHGVLHLLEPAAPRGLRLPIDFFFRSLADDQQERSIGVILSGMGSDGTLGLGPSRRRRAWSSCRTPASAKFDGMPRSAIDAGLADVVAPAEELPGKIVAYLAARAARRPARRGARTSKTQSALEKVFVLLRTRPATTSRCTRGAPSTAASSGAWACTSSTSIASYVRYLQENPAGGAAALQGAADRRDQLLPRSGGLGAPARRQVIPALLADAPGRRGAAGLGARLLDRRGGLLPGHGLQGGAGAGEAGQTASPSRSSPPTSTRTPSTRRARASTRPTSPRDVSPERLRRFFVKEEHGYRVGKEIREMVVFAPQNLIMDPPFTKLDILSCRNLLIYLSPELQKRLLPLFHYSLNPGGVLFLGSAETIGALRRPLRAARRQGADLPAARRRPAGRARRVSRPRSSRPRPRRRRRRSRRRPAGRQPPGAGRPAAARSATPRPPC